jgi:hypothetical protein
MIATEERTKARFGDGRGNHGNCDDYGGNRKHRPDNTVASAEKKGKSGKFEDLENLNGTHTAGDCHNFQNYTRKNNQHKGKGKGKEKEDDPQKDQDDQGGSGF